ncbi:MAG: hypothetical protein QRY74_06045 [Chlamydia sp.]
MQIIGRTQVFGGSNEEWLQQYGICLDGKIICNSGMGGEKAIHIVSASSAENILGQLATEAKSNEINVFPLLLKLLDLN